MQFAIQRRRSYHVCMSNVVRTLQPQKLITVYGRGAVGNEESIRDAVCSLIDTHLLYRRAVAQEALVSATFDAWISRSLVSRHRRSSLACWRFNGTFSHAWRNWFAVQANGQTAPIVELKDGWARSCSACALRMARMVAASQTKLHSQLQPLISRQQCVGKRHHRRNISQRALLLADATLRSPDRVAALASLTSMFCHLGLGRNARNRRDWGTRLHVLGVYNISPQNDDQEIESLDEDAASASKESTAGSALRRNKVRPNTPRYPKRSRR